MRKVLIGVFAFAVAVTAIGKAEARDYRQDPSWNWLGPRGGAWDWPGYTGGWHTWNYPAAFYGLWPYYTQGCYRTVRVQHGKRWVTRRFYVCLD